jgi:hypothetical protein
VTNNGPRAFDFLHGTWRVTNRRVIDRGDPACDRWETFDAVSTVEPVLGGWGHTDRFVASRTTAAAPFEGFTLRLYEPSSRTWRLWWCDTARPGRLDPPMVGTFTGAVGRFEGADELGGRPVRLRFVWDATTEGRPRWEQAFSWDDGVTWTTNWVMELLPGQPARSASATPV